MIVENKLYQEDLKRVSGLLLEWNRLKNKSILISGSTGMIGSFLIDVIMYKNHTTELNCRVIALGRSEEKARQRFRNHWKNNDFVFIKADINKAINISNEKIDYIFHAASNTHPVAYAADPIGTITTNIMGTYNLLELAAERNAERFVFASSVEIYGENRGDVDKFSEDYCGHIDCNTLRAGYPESKRAGEALCQAYLKQKKIDIVIPRLPRTYGPTMLMSDTKAISQFIKKGIAHENIILKSEGTQLYSYCYAADSVSGILYCMLNGKCGEAYNIADEASDITLRELANIIAEYAGKRIVFEVPDAAESAGYSKATKALLDSSKIRELGWRPIYDIQSGLERTMEILGSSGIGNGR